MVRHKRMVNVQNVLPYLLFIATFFVLLNMSQLSAAWVNIYEDTTFALDPSAERAYAYGSGHMDSERAISYDIDRAEYFFQRAFLLDPELPYLNHQIARVAFLRGDFNRAMLYINREIAMHPEHSSAYYVRGLIEGFMGDYDRAATDYEEFLKHAPTNWAAINDYAWVLLKAGRAEEAAKATEQGLQYFPENPWLLNNSAIALYEVGELEKAYERAQRAWDHVQMVAKEEWLHSYPGNDPAIASEGIATFRTAVSDNMHRIELALASSTVQ